MAEADGGADLAAGAGVVIGTTASAGVGAGFPLFSVGRFRSSWSGFGASVDAAEAVGADAVLVGAGVLV